MAIINGYCTLIELKARMPRIDTTKDSFLEDCVERASRLIDWYTGRFYYSKSVTAEIVDQYDFSSSGLSISMAGTALRSPVPFITVSTIVEGGLTLVANSDYFVYPYQILRFGVWSSEPKDISFTGTLGYSATPENVKEWCLAISEVLSGLGMRTVTDGSGGLIDIIKNSVPKWVMDDIKREQVAYA